jgi:hypothetical protein
MRVRGKEGNVGGGRRRGREEGEGWQMGHGAEQQMKSRDWGRELGGGRQEPDRTRETIK